MTFEEAQRKLLKALSSFCFSAPNVYKTSKIIHDPIWGTCDYNPWEMALIDLPLFQRLRGLKQTGLAFLTYPASEHSRFQHTLGVMAAASDVFDSICDRAPTTGTTSSFKDAQGLDLLIADRERTKALLRLAALVHDTGHSILSHTSERIFSLIEPFSELSQKIKEKYSKKPGAAEIVVFLLVTSKQWQEIVESAWKNGGGPGKAPTPSEWEQIGRWIMGIEPDPTQKFLCDIISGPLDADKLDYVSRDAYFAGIPISHDLHRFVSTVCVDVQENPQTKVSWSRLTLPLGKGVNALEQLVMSRLVLFSYLYHHQKVRAAESSFERLLAREFLSSGTVAKADLWDLFAIQDAHIYCLADGKFGNLPLTDITFRALPVRVIEFRKGDVVPEGAAESQQAFEELFFLGQPDSWDDYRKLLEYEDSLAERAGLPKGSVVVDFPREPRYADLEALKLPGRDPMETPSVKDYLAYQSWIHSYSQYRLYCRVFCPRELVTGKDSLWKVLVKDFEDRELPLKQSAHIH